MKILFAMRRANGDWFALDDNNGFRVPLFQSTADAMVARLRDPSMICFKPVVLDKSALQNLTKTQEGIATFWLIEDPLRKLSRGFPLDQVELLQFVAGDGIQVKRGSPVKN